MLLDKQFFENVLLLILNQKMEIMASSTKSKVAPHCNYERIAIVHDNKLEILTSFIRLVQLDIGMKMRSAARKLMFTRFQNSST